MRVLNSQKNNLYELIEGAGLSPAQFELEENGTNKHFYKFKLSYKQTEYYLEITFETIHEKYNVEVCPWYDRYKQCYLGTNWDSVESTCHDWLQCLMREIETPDKWKRLEEEMKDVSINIGDEENKFSVGEYLLLKQKMETIKLKAVSIGLLPEQLEALNNKIDYLTELATDMNKFDWKNLFIGTMISILIQLAVTQENAKALWDIIKSTFGTFVLP